ncbi:YadA-like family protein [Buttiauxella noackiae]|uniref:YadA-like family protein n=1 Tax=Buttiauxella noackiae TaxID=82992 RepID=UPI0028D5E7D4|nr:YadA-like family protein [Buttiauxella noackiae]
MNKIYRLVWNSAQKAWVVAGEFAGAKGKGASSLRIAKRVSGLTGAVAATLLSFPAEAWVAGTGTSSAALDNNNAANTSINGGVATGNSSTAIGPTASASGSSATAIGQSATASAIDSIALGHSASATIVNGIAIGQGAKASGGNGAMAVGSLSAASSDGAIAFGSNSVASDTNATAIGRSSVANGYSAVAIGDMAKATPDHSTAIGGGSLVTGLEGTSIGWYANTAGVQAQALGYYANAKGANSTAIGPNASSAGDYSLALGSTASAAGSYGIAIGSNAVNHDTGVFSFESLGGPGADLTNKATSAISLGTSSYSSRGGIAIGDHATVPDSDANVQGGVALGSYATAGGAATAIGVGTTAAQNAVAVGAVSAASGLGATAFGTSANAQKIDSLAIGHWSNSTSDYGVAVGSTAVADSADSVALGHSARALSTAPGSVALGAGTTADRAGMAGGKELFSNTAVASTKGAVSVGDVGSERQITNVAGGTQATDAVNVRQLQAVSDSSVHYDTNPDGTVNYNNVTMGGTTYNNTTHTGGTKITNVADGSVPSDAVNFSQLTTTNNNINNIYATGTKYFHANSTGADSKALGADAIAVGVNAVADANSANAITMGNGASATTAAGSVVIGTNATAKYTVAGAAANQVAIGNAASATGPNAVALGNSTNSAGASAVAIGMGASSAGGASVATGWNSSSAGATSAAYGMRASAAGSASLALGSGASASTDNSVALGAGSTTSAAALTNPVYVPKGANAADMKGTPSGEVSVGSAGSERRITNLAAGAALTDAVNVSQLKSLADESVQYDKNGDGTINYNSMTLGGTTYNNSTHTGGTKITNVADGSAPSDAVNFSQLTTTNNNINNIYATGTKYFHANSTGADSKALGADAIAVGVNAVADANSANAIAMGNGASATAAGNSVVIGNQSSASYTSNPLIARQVVIGDSANTTGISSIAIGGASSVTANAAVALGPASFVSGSGAIAIGSRSIATGATSVALGASANASANNSVAIGYNTTTTANLGQAAYVPKGANAADMKGSATGEVSIGSAGSERRITNLAAGAALTDAVNVSQLKSLADESVQYDKNGDGTVNYNSMTLGGTTYNSTTHTGGTKITNVADGSAPSDAVNFSQLTTTNNNINNIYATGTKYFHANSTGTDSVASGIDAIAIGMNAVADVARSVALGDGAKTQAAVGTTGTTLLGTDYAFAGTAPVGTVSIGDKGSERTLTNLAAGSLSATSTDGVNGSQLFATNTALSTITGDVTNLDAGSVKYDKFVDGTVNYNNITLGGDTYDNSTHTGGTKITNVADGSAPSDAVNFSQLTETNNTINNMYETGTKYFHANSTGADSVASGTDAVAIGMGAVADVARSIALGDGAKTQAAVATSGATIAGTDYAFAGSAPVGTVSIGKAGEERTLTNMAAGRLSADSTDGVNGSQLFATNTAVDALDAGAVKYDRNGDGTVNYNSVTMGGNTYNSITKTGGTRITNVARGENDSDAVNMSQLNETNTTVNYIDNTLSHITGNTTTTYTSLNGEGIRYVRTNEDGLLESDSSAEGQGSTAVGYNALSTGDNSLAIGREAQAINANDVALGSGSITDIAVGTSGAKIGDVDYLFAGSTPTSTVSVGSRGHERTITNVAAGRLSSDSTDAINGSQLFATNSAINTLDKGSVKYDIHDDGTVNYNSISLGGDTYNSVTKTGGTRIKNVAYGIDAGDAVNVQQLTDATTNIYTNGVKYFHANSGKADSVASGSDSVAVGPNAQSMGNSSIAMGDEAKSIGNGSMAMGAGAVANNAGDIALGAGSTTSAAVATTGTTIRGNDYAFAGTAPTSTLSVGSEGNERTITNVAAGRIAADSTDAVNGSELYATNQAIENIGSNVKNIDKGSVKYITNVDGSISYNNVVLGGDTYDNSTHTGGTTISNVADGVAPSDAVNKHQLDVVNQTVTNISNGTDGMFQVNNTSNNPKPRPTGKDSVAGGAGALASGDNSVAIGTNSHATHNNAIALGNNSVTDRDNSVSVGFTGGERQITNVAAGTKGTDAVNLSQLKDGVNSANQYTNNKFNDLKNIVDDNKDKLSAGIAGAMAMASLPQPYQPGASMVSMGGGTYQGEAAVALGVSTISDNGKWVTKLSGTSTSQGDLGAAVGVGYQW